MNDVGLGSGTDGYERGRARLGKRGSPQSRRRRTGFWHDRAMFHFLRDCVLRERRISTFRRAVRTLRSGMNSVAESIELQRKAEAAAAEMPQAAAEVDRARKYSFWKNSGS